MSRHPTADEDEELTSSTMLLSFQNSALMAIIRLMTTLGNEQFIWKRSQLKTTRCETS